MLLTEEALVTMAARGVKFVMVVVRLVCNVQPDLDSGADGIGRLISGTVLAYPRRSPDSEAY